MREIKRVSKITDELTTYCIEHKASLISIELENDPKAWIFCVRAQNVTITEKEIARLRRMLNSKRELEMEEYFWSLAGEGRTSDELPLVAAMVDQAEVYVEEGNHLFIRLVRNKKPLQKNRGIG